MHCTAADIGDKGLLESFLYRVRPYHVENTSSRPITEVKQHWAALVLGWVTAWEYAVLYTFWRCFRPVLVLAKLSGRLAAEKK